MQKVLNYYKKHIMKEYVGMLIASGLIFVLIFFMFINNIGISTTNLDEIFNDFVATILTIPFALILIATLIMLYKLRSSERSRVCDNFIIVKKLVKEKNSKHQIKEAIDCRNSGCSVLTSEMMSRIEKSLPHKIKNLWELINLALDEHAEKTKELS